MIKCLPGEVQGKLRSGVAVPSLQQCVEELLLNSVDAGSSCVGVRMDTEALKVQVIDNGAGMSAEDLGRAGNRYHTSKCSSVGDLDHLRWFGFRGEALASVVSLSALVEISSRTRSSVKTHVKIFKDGKSLDVFEAEASRPSAGTTVIVCNFFRNLPVRRKRVDAVLEGERIRHRLEAISLMHPFVSFTLKNDCTGAMMVQLSKARDTYHRFVQIHGRGRAEKLGEISHTHGQFEVTGYLGREGHYNNSLQFLYVNDRLLLKTRIHKLLNFLLRRVSSSNQRQDSPDGPSVLRSPKHKRTQELYGVYVINIRCSYSQYDICLEPAKTLIEFRDWDGVLLCVEEAVKTFLSRENLVAVISQDDLDCASPKMFATDRTEQEGNSGLCTTFALDCGVGIKLASESVHRKCSDDGVGQERKTEEREEQNSAADDLEKIHSEKCVIQECRDEPNCDSVASCTNINEEAGAGSNIVPMSNRLEDVFSKERPIGFNTSTSKSPHGLNQQAHADLNCAETLVSNGKISLSDPYIHDSLQTRDVSRTHGPVFQRQNVAAKCEEKSFASKRKISLDAGRGRSSPRQQRDPADIIPSKIPRIISCQKLSIFKESGSLDKFRRMYVKSDELKLPHLEAHLQNKVGLPRTDSFVFNPKNISVRQEDQREVDVTETREQEETESSCRSPPTHSGVTALKPVSAQSRGKRSLAAKLCHLKEHGTEDSEVSLHVSRATTQDQTCSGGGRDPVRDGDVGEKPRDLPAAEKEDDAPSGDWLHHFDTSVGKTVYVNRVTGLSRYEDPAAEETHARCTSDVTNMAVSVISEMDDGAERSNSLSSLYSKWNNPVFVRPPMVGVDISGGQADGLAVKIHNILFPYRFSKAMIHSMKVIHQVDKKFLACLINTRDDEPVAEGNLLVLVDQHAAHERVRLENLVADSYEEDHDAVGEKRLCSSTILPPLEISVTEEERRLLRSCQPHLRSLGLEVTFSQAADPQVFVGKVPLCFMEKESNELRRGRPSVIKPIVEEYLREQIELLCSTGRVRGTLPLTVLKVLASLACHGAIKFNDTLSRDECHSLVASLSSCQLPFQCAHGRPSIVPLVDVLHLDKEQKELQKPNLQKLRRMYKAWQLYGNG
ncbi:DNA mismatch repair protein Mlh3 isoform X2 [Brachyistius frenatus]|uniref:DNA mismatch repair protein Mlh3 isoform X2 n=1 Tax=Brachyistius frenatus TaxID=100188 RepID=UPI0037E965BA